MIDNKGHGNGDGKLKKFHDTLYAMPDDTFGKRLDQAVEACEAFFRTKLKLGR